MVPVFITLIPKVLSLFCITEKVSKKLEQEKRSLAKNARDVWSNSLSRIRTESQAFECLSIEGKVSSATLPMPRPARSGK